MSDGANRPGAKKRYALTVRGDRSTWSFEILARPQHVEDWRRDGLEVDELLNVIPAWAVDLGLTRIWCFVQDVFHFKNPFRNEGVRKFEEWRNGDGE
jgi:hypothetical protein